MAGFGGRIGGISSPLVLLLVYKYDHSNILLDTALYQLSIVKQTFLQASYYEGLPMALMGCLAVATGVLGLALPETLNQPMPETLQGLEEQFP